MQYRSPAITEMGSLHELTLDTIHKTRGGTDTVVYDDGSIETIPGHGATVS